MRKLLTLTAFLLAGLAAHAQNPTQGELSKVIPLEGSVVTASPPLVTVVADTVVFNASAVILEEDASLKDLLRRIPGLDVDDHGNITLNGRVVRQLLIDGKEYFAGNVRAGLENLPAEMISKVKAYDRLSEMARLTGIEDGEEEPVLDLTIKKQFMKGWHNVLNASAGTSNRYSTRFSGNKLEKQLKESIIANARNTANISSSNDVNANGTGGSGDAHRGELGYSYAKSSDSLKLSWNIHYEWLNRDIHNTTYNEYLTSSSTRMSDSESFNTRITHTVKADGMVEWKRKKVNSFYVKPAVTLAYVGTENNSTTKTYYTAPSDPSNSNVSSSSGWNARVNMNTAFSWNHRFPKRGRSFSTYNQISANFSRDNQTSLLSTRYYKISSNPDSTLVRDRNVITDSPNFSIFTMGTWNEPFGKHSFLQLQSRLSYRNNMSDKENWILDGGAHDYDAEHSAEGTYQLIQYQFSASYRYSKKNLNTTLGATAMPVWSWLDASGGGSASADIFMFHVVPNLVFNWTPSGGQKLSFSWKTNLSNPNTSYLLPVSSNTNPLYIRESNPYLKPSLTQTAALTWNKSNKKRQSSFVLGANFSMIDNAVSNSTVYDELTGGRVITPKNVNGSWNASGSFTYNKTFGKHKWSLSSYSVANWKDSKSYLYNSKLKMDEVNTITRLMLKEDLNLTWALRRADIIFGAGGISTSERSLLRPAMNEDPYSCWGLVSVVYKTPWKMTVSADFKELLQRGYKYSTLNRNYHILDARITKKLIKNKLLLKIEANDILRQYENTVHSFTSERRYIAKYNGVPSYALVGLVWKFDRK